MGWRCYGEVFNLDAEWYIHCLTWINLSLIQWKYYHNTVQYEMIDAWNIKPKTTILYLSSKVMLAVSKVTCLPHLPPLRQGHAIYDNLEFSSSNLVSPWKLDRNTDGQLIKTITSSGDLQHVVLMCTSLFVECTEQWATRVHWSQTLSHIILSLCLICIIPLTFRIIVRINSIAFIDVPSSSLYLVLLFYLFCSSIVINAVIVTTETFEP